MSERNDPDFRVERLSSLDQGREDGAPAQVTDQVFPPDLSLTEEG